MDKYQKSVEDEAWRGAIKRVGNEIKDYPDNLQNVHTPFKLCSEILEKLNEHVSLGSLGSILCLNLEFVANTTLKQDLSNRSRLRLFGVLERHPHDTILDSKAVAQSWVDFADAIEPYATG
jgi:hypothetical protein